MNPAGETNKATFTINLGGVAGRLAWGPNNPPGSFPTFSDLRFEVKFLKLDGTLVDTITRDGPATGVIQGDIDPGEYTVTLDIYFRDGGGIYLYANGSLVDDIGNPITHVTIVSGSNTVVHIKATQVIDDGSSTNPFKVYDETTLQAVGSGGMPYGTNPWGRAHHYVLMKDVTLTVPWTPLCTGTSPFLGIFDGNGKTINLGSDKVTTNASGGNFFYAGLFDAIYIGSMVKNLRLEGSIDVSSLGGGDYVNVGAVAAQANGGSIMNVYSNVNITAASGYLSYAGGIVGDNNGGNVLNCRNEGTITGNGPGRGVVGGIVGQNSGTVTFCWGDGNIIAPTVTNTDTGGIAGIIRSSGGTLTNCVALNNTITGGFTSYTGRVFGRTQTTTIDFNFANDAMSGVTVTEDYQTGKDGEDANTTQANNMTWWTTTAGWTSIQANKSAASESNPWYWGAGNRPRLWFE